ncbi:MAG: mutT [Parachlamydiales bacterium]|nr:mutT [Parachlamydiales bacterium]
MKKPDIRSSRTVYRGYYNVRMDSLMRSDGALFDYTVLDMSVDAAIVIAETVDGLIVVNREYRHPTGEWVLGFPGGRLETGEDPLIGGQRELFEETGYWSDDITLIGTCYPLPSILNQKIYFFHAKNAVLKSRQHLDPFEFIEIELKTEPDLKKEIREGMHIDSMMCSALWYKSLVPC